MKLFFELDRIATKLEITVQTSPSADKNTAAMEDAVRAIRAQMEFLAPAWGELTAAVKRLEKGK